MQRIAKITIRPPWSDRTILDVLSRRFTYHSREEWRDLLSAGRVSINAAPVAPTYQVQAGDVLQYDVPAMQEPAVSTDYRVVLREQGVLVVDKPANLPCHPAGRFFNHTLWALLRDDLALETLHFISRLDRETSGLVLIATDDLAAASCRNQARHGTLLKEYRVVVEGRFDEPRRTRGWLSRDHDSIIRKKRRFRPGESAAPNPGKTDRIWAETDLEPLRFTHQMTLIKATLRTGRTHQIRATLCSLGYPVVGDKIYGPDDTIFLRFISTMLTAADQHRLRLDRQALHAARLSFRLPGRDAPVDLTAPLPPDMARLIS